MTQIVLSFDATPPADEHQPEGWAIGYVVGILRTAGVVVHDAKATVPAAPVDLEGLDVGPGVRKVLAQAAKVEPAVHDSPTVPELVGAADREARHAARRAAAADAM